ncbi:MAG: glucose-6-phosphate dehydrogenase [Gemmatimonadetes bacterium]|nr:glucose-6-phosphate dehydrogenase [Gemmatimonadota bacterium]
MTDSLLSPDRIPDPCVLVIFGASGDLTRRKLLPAVWHLLRQGRLPDGFALIGVARTRMTTEEFRERMRASLHEFVDLVPEDEQQVEDFLDSVEYLSGDPSAPETYRRLNQRLREIDGQRETGGNRCYYCSVPPQVYLDIVERLGAAGLAREGEDGNGWIRIIVEKPFGHDLTSARSLNQSLHEVFDEHQIYRIDHYLGKETVQNLLVFRLANSMFEPLWNRRYVDHVQITAAEAVGVEHRAGYYDTSGALRDMIQNHLLQVMCVIAMEPPSTFDAESVRTEKLKVLKAVSPFSIGQVDQIAVRGQYSAGVDAAGQTCHGYLQERDVPEGSHAETFAAIEFTIDNWRWQGVPFYVRTGKRMARRASAITLQFKQPPHLIFTGGERLRPSTLTIRIQPEEGISLAFSGKRPGPDVQLDTVEMDFCYADHFGGRSPEAYETLILDCLVGDGTLFASSDWIEKSWELLMPILEAWNAASATQVPGYPAGTWGPKEADSLFDREWRRWEEV